MTLDATLFVALGWYRKHVTEDLKWTSRALGILGDMFFYANPMPPIVLRQVSCYYLHFNFLIIQLGLV